MWRLGRGVTGADAESVTQAVAAETATLPGTPAGRASITSQAVMTMTTRRADFAGGCRDDPIQRHRWTSPRPPQGGGKMAPERPMLSNVWTRALPRGPRLGPRRRSRWQTTGCHPPVEELA